jgi:hypothetical protein
MSILQDYWHHWEDVTVGFFLGVLCAFVSYRQHYPGIASQRAGEAFVISKGIYHALFLLPVLGSFSTAIFTWLTALAAKVQNSHQQLLFVIP